MENRTVTFDSLEGLMKEMAESVKKVEAEIQRHNALVGETFGRMPKNEMQLAEFVRRVIRLDDECKKEG